MCNTSIPRFDCWVRERYLYQLDQRETLVKGVAFAVASIPARAIGFHVLLQNGAMIGRLPPSAICLKPDAKERPTHHLQLWNCFSYDVTAIEYDFLEAMRCQVRLRNGEDAPGSYMFTLDWHGSQDAEDVGDLGWKCGHVIELDDGNIAIQPNNRIRWAEPSFTDHEAEWPPKYKTINYTMTCEKYGKLVIEDDRMFFEAKEGASDGQEETHGQGADTCPGAPNRPAREICGQGRRQDSRTLQLDRLRGGKRKGR